MKIILDQVGKRYNRDWIFRNINFEFVKGEAYAILGANGSGKSTLLQLISGSITVSEGSIKYARPRPLSLSKGEEGEKLEPENIFRYLSFAAPYLELIEEYTLKESVGFHSKFKKFVSDFDNDKIIEITGLQNAKDKQLKYFSSGMKQRVRLALALLSDTSIVLLDEPATNLDKNGIDWYRNLIDIYSQNRLVIVCSNQQAHEYDFCKTQLNISDYK